MTRFPWECPICNKAATITDVDYEIKVYVIDIPNKSGAVRTVVTFVVCPNEKCKEFTLEFDLDRVKWSKRFDKWQTIETINSWSLIPSSQAKPFPGYIPAPIIKDYKEACLIKDLSPNASATMARRCLQGMIRDFWGVIARTLAVEIDLIKDDVDPDIWKAIKATKDIGNIGAHMEEDINLIIEVDPEEAGYLIKLIEILLNDWYISRHKRKEQLKTITEIDKAKKKQKKSGKKVVKTQK